MAKKITARMEMITMQDIDHEGDRLSIRELYRHKTENGELSFHRIDTSDGTAGEILLSFQSSEKQLTIKEVFVERKFRRMGLGSSLLNFAEDTACSIGFNTVEVMPFSLDPIISDAALRDWYKHRGYVKTGTRMLKRLGKKQEKEMTT